MLKLNIDPRPGLPLEVEIKTVRPYGDVLSRGKVDIHANNGGGDKSPPPQPALPSPPPTPDVSDDGSSRIIFFTLLIK